MTEKQKRKLVLLWTLNLVFLVLFVSFLRNAGYALFVNEAGGQYTRIQTAFNMDRSVTTVQFDLDIPTVGPFVVLVASILGIGLGIRVAVHLWRRKEIVRAKRGFILMAIILFIQIITTMIVFHDFFSSAGSFG